MRDSDPRDDTRDDTGIPRAWFAKAPYVEPVEIDETAEERYWADVESQFDDDPEGDDAA